MYLLELLIALFLRTNGGWGAKQYTLRVNLVFRFVLHIFHKKKKLQINKKKN